jgi:hypothetical protein
MRPLVLISASTRRRCGEAVMWTLVSGDPPMPRGGMPHRMVSKSGRNPPSDGTLPNPHNFRGAFWFCRIDPASYLDRQCLGWSCDQTIDPALRCLHRATTVRGAFSTSGAYPMLT